MIYIDKKLVLVFLFLFIKIFAYPQSVNSTVYAYEFGNSRPYLYLALNDSFEYQFLKWQFPVGALGCGHGTYFGRYYINSDSLFLVEPTNVTEHVLIAKEKREIKSIQILIDSQIVYNYPNIFYINYYAQICGDAEKIKIKKKGFEVSFNHDYNWDSLRVDILFIPYIISFWLDYKNYNYFNISKLNDFVVKDKIFRKYKIYNDTLSDFPENRYKMVRKRN